MSPATAITRIPRTRWDELDIEAVVLDQAMRSPKQPLDSSERWERTPGIYFVFYRGELAPYRLVADATYPVYIGSAQDLGERFRRHRRNTSTVANLHGGRDLLLLPAVLHSHAAARYIEALLVQRLEPCWNQTWLGGFGSRPQGATRLGQVPPPWNALHPGRAVGNGTDRISRSGLRRRLVSHLTETARPGLFTEGVRTMPMRSEQRGTA